MLKIASAAAFVGFVASFSAAADAQEQSCGLIGSGEFTQEVCISLEPESASNLVGTEHAVSATVFRAEDGHPRHRRPNPCRVWA